MKSIDGIITWLKNWFYDEGEIDGFITTLTNSINSKLNSNLTEANKNLVTNGSGTVVLEDKPVIPDVSGKIDTAGTGLSKSGTTLNHSNSVTAQSSAVFKKFSFDGQGHITGIENVGSSDLPSHTHSLDNVTDDQVYDNITPSGSTIRATFNAIDTAIGDLGSIRAIEAVSTLPTASADTMGKLYIISENSKINVYYTQQDGQTFEWHKMDADILDELVVNWSDVQNKPSSFPPSSHSHGNINNDGTLTQQLSSSVINGILVLSSINKIVYTPKIPLGLVNAMLSYPNMGYDGTGSQHNVNSAIDTALGNKLSATKVTSWSSTTSNANVPSEKLVKDSLDGKAPTSHASSATTYGIGTTSNYGHNKIRDNLTASTLTNGESLSAHQGYVLKGLVDDLEDTIASFDASNIDFDPASQIWGEYTQVVHTVANGLDWLKEITNSLNTSVIGKQDEITSIVLVPKATDANGKIIFYTGDEPT